MAVQSERSIWAGRAGARPGRETTPGRKTSAFSNLKTTFFTPLER